MRVLLALLLLLALAGAASAHFHEDWRVREHLVWANQTKEDEVAVVERMTIAWHGEDATNGSVYTLVMRTAHDARFTPPGEAGGEAQSPLLKFDLAARNRTLRPGAPLHLEARYTVVSTPGDDLAFSKAPLYNTDRLTILPTALPGYRAVPEDFDAAQPIERIVGDGAGREPYTVRFEPDRALPAPGALAPAFIGALVAAAAARRK